ncbi:MAG: hypothetical protein Sapg2KO_38980 [Saprospiraceae bacterium]
MKTSKSITALFLLLLPILSHAQFKNRLSIGPRAGLNFATVDAESAKRVTGLAAGITSTYSINEGSGVSVDLLYSAEGYEQGGIEYDLNYFKIPLAYNVFFGSLGEKFRPKVYLGLVPGFLLNAEVNGTDVADQYTSTTFDALGGLGFNYRLASRIWLNTDLRFYLGLNDISETTSIKNQNIQFTLGVAYGI